MVNFVFRRKHFFCPLEGREVEVDFLALEGKPGNLLGVKSCSAFREGRKIDCGKSCVHLPWVQAAPSLSDQPFSPTVNPPTSYTDEVLENITRLMELLDEEVLQHLPDLPFLELVKPAAADQEP
jgi:hypothetical protein